MLDEAIISAKTNSRKTVQVRDIWKATKEIEEKIETGILKPIGYSIILDYTDRFIKILREWKVSYQDSDEGIISEKTIEYQLREYLRVMALYIENDRELNLYNLKI